MANHFETEMARPRELLAPSLLLLLAESPGHGYELMERLRPLGFDWGGPGPIYRDLRSLEDAGLITSDWFVSQSGPGRRVYEITPLGRESLDRSVAGVLGLQRLIAEYQARVSAIARPMPLAGNGAQKAEPVLPAGAARDATALSRRRRRMPAASATPASSRQAPSSRRDRAFGQADPNLGPDALRSGR